ncbi:Pyruvate/Phosphoenolpyruvate kinase-like domain-containing protein [Podospora appendiculata]|uniref:Pyruvate/Phosphoenolpyruvate kinase-like domain-containing protein n=1 Tax=Podospora appendiculata TaxID=314037 RepID=A0AAE0XFK8_9PEZI|nr:Pyruvate/Phosphoenolpyruvate kinase-like domain-containing protein [Podospora appendiculata]
MAAARLRDLISQQGRIIVCPGVYDGLTARIALRDGFDCLYMTGAGTSLSRLGMPDLGLATMNDMLANAGMIASLDRRVPLIADADTGYGGPVMVARTVKAYIAAGVAGLHLEDQVLAKRCGHLLGKEIVPADVFLSRIRAAVIARDEMRAVVGAAAGDIVLIARTDALQAEGFDAAVARLRSAVDAGADVAFLEGLTSLEQGRRVCALLAPTPVLLNMVPGGVTPDISAEEAREAGFRLVIHPGVLLSAVFEAGVAASRELRDTGRVRTLVREGKAVGPRELFEVAGLAECLALDKMAGGQAYEGGV